LPQVMRIIMAFFLLQCVDVLTFIGVYEVQLFAINVPEDRRHLKQDCHVCETLRATWGCSRSHCVSVSSPRSIPARVPSHP
jgi:hypothetical protein